MVNVQTDAPVPGNSISNEPFRERRGAGRAMHIYARRRTGEVRHSHLLSSSAPVPRHPRPERRRARIVGFDVAAALELNLKNFPTSSGMLILLRSWLYAVEREASQHADVA